MRTKRTPLILAIAIALFTLMLGVKPAQAQVATLPAAGARYTAPTSAVGGRTFDSKLYVWSLIPAQFSAPAAEVVCVKGEETLSGSATGITGLNTGESNTAPFERTTTAYVPPSLIGFACTVSSLVSFGGDATFPASFTIEILPAATGFIDLAENNHAITGGVEKFEAFLNSNVGPVSFGSVHADLTCDGGLFDDVYNIPVNTPPASRLDQIYFYVGLPAVQEDLICHWSGTFDADGAVYQLEPSNFVIRAIVVGPPPDPTYQVGLPLVMAP